MLGASQESSANVVKTITRKQRMVLFMKVCMLQILEKEEEKILFLELVV